MGVAGCEILKVREGANPSFVCFISQYQPTGRPTSITDGMERNCIIGGTAEPERCAGLCWVMSNGAPPMLVRVVDGGMVTNAVAVCASAVCWDVVVLGNRCCKHLLSEALGTPKVQRGGRMLLATWLLAFLGPCPPKHKNIEKDLETRRARQI